MSLLAGVESELAETGQSLLLRMVGGDPGRRSPPTGAGARRPGWTASCCSTSRSTTRGRRCSTSWAWRSSCTATARLGAREGAAVRRARRRRPARRASRIPRPPAGAAHRRTRRVRARAGPPGCGGGARPRPRHGVRVRRVGLLDGGRRADRGAGAHPRRSLDHRRADVERLLALGAQTALDPRGPGRRGDRQLGRLAAVPPGHAPDHGPRRATRRSRAGAPPGCCSTSWRGAGRRPARGPGASGLVARDHRASRRRAGCEPAARPSRA